MRPAGLTAVCIISLIVGVLGGFAVVAGCGGLMFRSTIMKLSQDFQKTVMSGAPQTPQLQQMQKQNEAMMNELVKVQNKWIVPGVAAMFVSAAAVVGLIVGGIRGLNLKPRAHLWMIVGFSAGILHALIASYIGYATQHDTQAIMVQQMNQAMLTVPGSAPPGARAMTSSAMQAGAAIGFAFIFGWAFLKCAAYATCIGYLLTPRNRKLFEGDGSDRAVIDALSAPPS